jgi:hypothetical protein
MKNEDEQVLSGEVFPLLVSLSPGSMSTPHPSRLRLKNACQIRGISLKCQANFIVGSYRKRVNPEHDHVSTNNGFILYPFALILFLGARPGHGGSFPLVPLQL